MLRTPPRRTTGADVHRRGALAGALAVGALALAGCGDDPGSLAAQAKAGDQKGYISGDGTVEKIAPADRSEPVSLRGALLDGGQWASSSAIGSIVVINVWGSWCAPCVAEAPHLQDVWEDVEKRSLPVVFMGIDFREDPARGLAFMTRMGLTYPSLSDESGTLILALQGKAPTVPTTLVLDRRGRIASRVNGPVDVSTLTALIDDAVAE
ncbi:TlpA family protein disulfide reductase [Phycicoccus jejuensis]|uniref:TlpA family protein disulfide reductase n=1 Tax=Phycicoccus jejuensis TaxID=367299 RepID=UPI00384EEA00